MRFGGSNEWAIRTIVRNFSTNRNFLIFFFLILIGSFFFKSWNRNFFLALLATCETILGEAKVGLAVLFCRFGALSGFCGLRWVCFPLGKIFPWCSSFSLRFCCAYSVFLSTNSVLVFVAFFLLWVFAVLFCRFALCLLSCLCLTFAFDFRLMLAWRSAFSLCSFCLFCSL